MAIIKSNSSLSAPTKKVNIGKFFASSQKKVQTAKVKQSSDALRNELVAIRDNVIKIDNLVRSNLIFQRKVSSDNRKNKEGEERSKREKKLESYKSKLPGVEFPVLPRFDFIESIKRFIFFTFLGAAFPKLIELVPKLVNFAKIISPAVNFFADVTKGLLNGLVTFIDWGYQIRDNTQKIAKQIGGENAEKKFNEFNRTLNTFIDLSILAGLTALDVGLDAERFRREQLKKGQQKPPRGRVGVTEGRGGAKGLGKGPVTTGRGGSKNLGRGARVTGSGVDKGPLSKLKGPFAKLKGPLSKFAGAAVPGLGAVVGAADARARFAAGDNVGGTLASISATLDTLVAGSAILAATGIGAAVPAAFATVSMGIDAVLLIRDIIKAFFPQLPMFVGGGRIRLMAQGGRVGSPGRSIKVSRKKLPIGKPQDTRPGKDVGGKRQILKLFPDGSPENIRQTTTASPWWARLFGGGNNQTTVSQPIGGKRPSPLKAIENTSKSLKKIPIPFISALMGAGSDVNLGQKPDKNLGDIVGGSIGKLTQDIIDNNMKLSFSDIVRFISGYANGGDVRSGNIIKENDIGYQVGSMVSKVISTAISSRVDEAINGILREITGQGKPPEGQSPDGSIGPGGNIIVSSDQPDFWLLATAALFEGISPQGYADVAQAIYNRVAMPGDPWRTGGSIRTAILNPTQFQPVRERGGVAAWSRIRDKQSAIAYTQSQGRTQAQLETAAAALLDTNRQRSARTFVGPRDSFRNENYEKQNNNLADDTEVTREQHTFGFEPRGATIASFRAGRLRPAEINRMIVTGTVTQDQEGNVSGYTVRTPSGGLVSSYSNLTAHHTYQSTSDGREVRDFTLYKGNQFLNVPVVSPVTGRVTFAGSAGAGGLWVEIISSSGQKVEMGHFNQLKVKSGDSVTAYKTVIGLQGHTGRTFPPGPEGTHVHMQAPSNVIRNYINSLSRGGTTRPDIRRPDIRPISQPPRPRRDNRPPSTVPPTLSRDSGRPPLDLRGLGFKKNPVTGVWEKASLAPSQSLNLGSGLNIQPSYAEGASSMVAIQLVNRTTIVSETA